MVIARRSRLQAGCGAEGLVCVLAPQYFSRLHAHTDDTAWLAAHAHPIADRTRKNDGLVRSSCGGTHRT